MTDHPITPPPELVQQWAEEHFGPITAATDAQQYIATQAARWGADQELEAVCDEILYCVAGIYEDKVSDWSELVDLLRDARRPQSPSLKEQALAVVKNSAVCDHLSPEHEDILRRALEQLDD